jgi:hypothetical protein
MDFRESTQADLDFAAEHSLYGGDKDQPDRIDYAFTLDHGDYILAVGGFRMITNSTAWGWIELTEYMGPHLMATYRVISEYMDIFCENHKICRLQAWVRDGFKEGFRVMRHLGFEEEYMLHDFLGKGENAIMFVRYYGGD